MARVWTTYEVRRKLSKLIEYALQGNPQVIVTNNTAVVVISHEKYVALTGDNLLKEEDQKSED